MIVLSGHGSLRGFFYLPAKVLDVRHLHCHFTAQFHQLWEIITLQYFDDAIKCVVRRVAAFFKADMQVL
jgi:hypothetical protein